MIIILFKNDLITYSFNSIQFISSKFDGFDFPCKIVRNTGTECGTAQLLVACACASIIISNFDENIRGIIALLHNDQS